MITEAQYKILQEKAELTEAEQLELEEYEDNLKNDISGADNNSGSNNNSNSGVSVTDTILKQETTVIEDNISKKNRSSTTQHKQAESQTSEENPTDEKESSSFGKLVIVAILGTFAYVCYVMFKGGKTAPLKGSSDSINTTTEQGTEQQQQNKEQKNRSGLGDL